MLRTQNKQNQKYHIMHKVILQINNEIKQKDNLNMENIRCFGFSKKAGKVRREAPGPVRKDRKSVV